jgi:hypothetical protein
MFGPTVSAEYFCFISLKPYPTGAKRPLRHPGIALIFGRSASEARFLCIFTWVAQYTLRSCSQRTNIQGRLEKIPWESLSFYGCVSAAFACFARLDMSAVQVSP